MSKFASGAGRVLLACLFTLGLAVELVWGQATITGGTYYLATTPLGALQSSVRVNTSVDPAQVVFGCERDREGSTIRSAVNGIQIAGGAAGSAPTITAVACTGGDTNIGITLTPAGTGSVAITRTLTDISQFYQAATNCVDTTASTAAVVVRAAANDFSLQRTAGGAETHNFGCFLTAPFRTTASKGWKLTSFSIVQQITVAALTSNTFNTLATTTYANNVADAIAAYGGTMTITMPTATQTNPYLTTGTPGTPAFMTTANAGVSVDWSAVMQNTGVYSVKGIVANWTYQD
jgi:hypothetical protein